MYKNGWSIDDCTQAFERLSKVAFQRRKIFDLPYLPYILELLVAYFTDGLYPAENIEAALKEVFGANRSILDYSLATTTGTLIGLPVATVDKTPSCRIFTNYNGAGVRIKQQGI